MFRGGGQSEVDLAVDRPTFRGHCRRWVDLSRGPLDAVNVLFIFFLFYFTNELETCRSKACLALRNKESRVGAHHVSL
jgi:hypothetical protein